MVLHMIMRIAHLNQQFCEQIMPFAAFCAVGIGTNVHILLCLFVDASY